MVEAQDMEKGDEPDDAIKRGPWHWLKAVALFICRQWFLVGIGLVILFAYLFPDVARHGGVLASQWSISYGLVGVIFLISGLTIPLASFYQRARAWKLHLAAQLTSFFLFPTLTFAIISAVRAADPEFKRFNRYALVGMQLMGVLPTTVSSNVIMTTQAGGDASATTLNVLFGNTVGTFLSPALLQMFFSSSTWAFGRPQATGNGGTLEIYRQVAMQLGCAVFAPLVVGEIIQYFFKTQVDWLKSRVPLAKLSSLCLLAVIWATFSGAFYENAFEVLSWQTIVFVLLVNIGLYIALSIFLFCLARKVPIPSSSSSVRGPRKTGPLLDVELTISLMFTGAAKGVVVGGPISAILYGGLGDPVNTAVVSLPLVLYQGSQVVLGQITVSLLRAWKKRTLVAEQATDSDDSKRTLAETESEV